MVNPYESPPGETGYPPFRKRFCKAVAMAHREFREGLRRDRISLLEACLGLFAAAMMVLLVVSWVTIAVLLELGMLD